MNEQDNDAAIAALNEAIAFRENLSQMQHMTLDTLREELKKVYRKEQEAFLFRHLQAFTQWHQTAIAIEDGVGLRLAMPDDDEVLSEENLKFFAGCGGLARPAAVVRLMVLSEQGNAGAALRLSELGYSLTPYMKQEISRQFKDVNDEISFTQNSGDTVRA